MPIEVSQLQELVNLWPEVEQPQQLTIAQEAMSMWALLVRQDQEEWVQ